MGVESEVPGAVIAGFRRGRTFQAVRDKASARYSEFVFAERAGRPVPAWKPGLDEVLGSLLGSQDLEDLLACWLQRRHGYLVMPGSRRADTLAYEFTLRHPEKGDEAVVQVKSGHQPVPCDAKALPVDSVAKAFVFSPTDSYDGELAENVTQVPFGDLVDFMREEPLSLPKRVERWVKYAAE